MSTSRLYLSLGSNQGPRHALLRQAIRLMQERVGRLVALSSFIETDPVGFRSSHRFLNAAACFETALTPLEILDVTQQIERTLGRVRKTVDAAYTDRPIDIDILLLGPDDAHLLTPFRHPRLTIPHPRMFERHFVLTPLAEILDLRHLAPLLHPDSEDL